MIRSLKIGFFALAALSLLASGALAATTAMVKSLGTAAISDPTGGYTLNVAKEKLFNNVTAFPGTSGTQFGSLAVHNAANGDTAMCFSPNAALSAGSQVTFNFTGGKIKISGSTDLVLYKLTAGDPLHTTNAAVLDTETQTADVSSVTFNVTTGQSLSVSQFACIAVNNSTAGQFSATALPDIIMSPGASDFQFSVTAGGATSGAQTYVGSMYQMYQQISSTGTATIPFSVNSDGKFYPANTSTVSTTAELFMYPTSAFATGSNTTAFATQGTVTAGEANVTVTVTGDMTPFSAVTFVGDTGAATTKSLTIASDNTNASADLSGDAVYFTPATGFNIQFTPQQNKPVTSLGSYDVTFSVKPAGATTARTFTYKAVASAQFSGVEAVVPYFNTDTVNYYTVVSLQNLTAKSSPIYVKASDRSGNVYAGKLGTLSVGGGTGLNPYGQTVILASDIIAALPGLPSTTTALSLELYFSNLNGPTGSNPRDTALLTGVCHMSSGGSQRTIPVNFVTSQGDGTYNNLR